MAETARPYQQLRYRSTIIGGGLMLLWVCSGIGGWLEGLVLTGLSGVGQARFTIGTYLLMMLCPLLLLRFWLEMPARQLFPMGKSTAKELPLMAVFSFGALIALNFAGWAFTGWLGRFFLVPPFTPEFGGTLPEILLRLVASSLIPAILEELVFRGAILQALRPFGDAFAISAGALLFMLCHSSITQWVPALGAGLLFGWLAVRTGSLRLGIAVHLMNNLYAAVANQIGSAITGTWIPLLLLILGTLAALLLLLRRRPQTRRREPPLPLRQRLHGLCTMPLLIAVAAMLWRTLAALSPR